MPTDVLQILIIIALLVAFVVTVRTSLLWRSLEEARAGLRADNERLKEWPDRAAASMTSFRGKLSATNAGIERTLWGLARFDEQSSELEGQLRSRRAAVDELRERHLASARRGITDIRRAIRLLRQLMEWRRTFLG